MPAEFPAITYAAASNEPLLEKSSKQQQQTPLIAPAAFQQFKNSSLYLGLLVGFFIQASTLGANYLVISVSGEDAMTTSKHNIVLFSLFWSLFTSSLAIIILAFLRNLVRATYETDEDNNEDDSRNDQLDDMILHMECRFVVGALVGVCMAWALTDMILGLSVQIVYSFVTLFVALGWCRLMMWCFGSELEDDEEDEEESTALMVV